MVQEFCVYTFGTSDFKIKGASSNGSGGGFVLSNNSESIPYAIGVGNSGGSGQGNLTNLVDGADYVTHNSWKGEDTQYCPGSENMRLELVILDSDISGKPAGVYSDTVTLTVAPD